MLKEKIENSLVFVLGGVLLTGFLSGIAVYTWLLDFAGREIADKTTLCPEGQVSLRFELTPKDAEISAFDSSKTFFQGKCFDKGRHQFNISAKGYKPTKRVVHLDRADRIEIVDLSGVINIDIDGSISKKYPENMERLSLNFQQIEVGAVLQLLADFTKQNIALQEGLNRTITLRLKDVPWEEAFDTILLLNGLEAHQSSNVILITEKE